MEVVKPGYKTTEFWLSLAALLLGAITASGLIPLTGPVAQVVGLLVGLLSALGYTVQRGLVKATDAKANAIVEAHEIQAKKNP